MPAAGKSAIAHRVGERLRGRGLSVAEPSHRLARLPPTRRIPAKAAYATRGVLTTPRAAAVSMRAIADSDQPSLASAIRTAFNWSFVAGTLAADRDVCLLDQGLSQAAWAVALGGRTFPDRLVGALDAGLRRPGRTLIVDVRVSDDAVAGRIRSRRDDSRVGVVDSAYSVGDARETTTRVREVLSRIAAARPSVELCTVENERPADLDACVATVEQRVLELPTVRESL